MSTESPRKELQRPVPDPEELTSIDDPHLRSRSLESWRNASRLRRLLHQWSEWFHEWESQGDADPGFALHLDEACRTSVQALRRLGADLDSLSNQSSEKKLEDRLPRHPWGRLLPIPWYEDEAEFERCVNGWDAEQTTALIGELWVWMLRLKASPSTSFIDPVALETATPSERPAFGIQGPSKSPAGNLTTPAKKAPKKKRDQGKAKLCVGIYMSAIARNETPPTNSEIAEMVDCSLGTVSRAISEWERKRKELAWKDAEELYSNAN